MKGADWGCALLACGLLVACAGEAAGPGEVAADGPRIAIELAALNLEGVGDVVWDVEVVNGAAQVVWQRRLTSSGYGDGAGSASFVGPCDADPAASQNSVRVWVVGVYAAPVSVAGAFDSGSATGIGAVTGLPLPFESPTATAPLARTVTCLANADTAVRFDVALMRPAQQGFFDIAVEFDDIFCAAKFDCCDDRDGTPGCAASGGEDTALLFRADGGRGATMVLGFACTAGPRAGVDATDLYLDALALDCSSPSAASFTADITLDPSGAAGNQCQPGDDGMSSCPAVAEPGDVDADDYLFQMSVFRGFEALTSGGVPAQKVYWNVALGVKRPLITTCWLRTRGTAADAAGSAVVADGTIAAGAVYPFVQWDVNLATCGEEPLTFGVPDAMVRTGYTGTGDGATSFAYGFGASMEAGSFCAPVCANGGQCVAGACVCAAGFAGPSCETDLDDCDPNPCDGGLACVDGPNSYACECAPGTVWDPATSACVSSLAGYAFVAAGTFVMGSPTSEPGHLADEVEHPVTLTRAFWMKRTEVTQSEWLAVMGNNPSDFQSGPEAPDRPVEQVTWWDAVAYVNRLSLNAGLPACYTATGCTGTPGISGYACTGVTAVGASCTGYRLPTESEWEYAARAGTTGPTYDDADLVAWHVGNAGGTTHPVGTKLPNPWGLYDVIGNVWEWCADWHAAYPGPAVDPVGPATGSDRVGRGTGWASGPAVRVAARSWAAPTFRVRSWGVRPVRTVGCPDGTTLGDQGECTSDLAGYGFVPAATFLMGSPTSEAGRGPDETQHPVTLTRSFWLGRTEVTQRAWADLMGNNPSTFQGVAYPDADDRPVETVTWMDALAYANALSSAAGLPLCYTLGGCSGVPGTGSGGAGAFSCASVAFVGPACLGYRLPTQAEFEHATRAGTTSASYGAPADVAWYDVNAGGQTHVVAGREPNAWGLHDLLGNAQERVWDGYGTLPSTPQTDPLGPSTFPETVVKGGAYNSPVQAMRSAYFTGGGPPAGQRQGSIGFRLARTIPATTVVLSASVSDYDVAAALGNPSDPVDAVVYIASGVTLSGSNGTTAALSTGALPAGSTLHLVNVGAILGGRSATSARPGGTAIRVSADVAVTIDNYGVIYGAGGNGGAGGRSSNGGGLGASAQGAATAGPTGPSGGGGGPGTASAGGGAGASDWYGAASGGGAGAGGSSCYIGIPPWGGGTGAGGAGAGYGGGGGGCSYYYAGGGGGGHWGGPGGGGGLDNAQNGGAWGYTVNGEAGGNGGAAIEIPAGYAQAVTLHAHPGSAIAGAVWNDLSGRYYTGSFAALASTSGQSPQAPAGIVPWFNGVGIAYR